MNGDFQYIQNRLDKLKSTRDFHIQSLEESIKTKELLERKHLNLKKLREVINLVVKNTQDEFTLHISSLVSLALKSVSKDFPNLKIEFVERRNQIEADILFEDNGHIISNLMDSSGGGALDIASLALVVAIRAIKSQTEDIRATFLMDQPLDNLSPDYHANASDLLRMLHEEHGIQFIIISHQEDLNVAADKTFRCEKKNGVSKIKEIT
jgi:DNA repair exonuclease SbcCD ATPase subunit